MLWQLTLCDTSVLVLFLLPASWLPVREDGDETQQLNASIFVDESHFRFDNLETLISFILGAADYGQQLFTLVIAVNRLTVFQSPRLHEFLFSGYECQKPDQEKKFRKRMAVSIAATWLWIVMYNIIFLFVCRYEYDIHTSAFQLVCKINMSTVETIVFYVCAF